MTTSVTISFGDVTFTGAEIKSAQLVEQINPLATELPINTLDFTLFSTAGDFSIINPSGFFAGLQHKQPIDVYENFDGAPVYMGKFYLDEWESISENEATFTAVDAIGILDATTYDGFLGGLNTIEAVVADIMAFAGLSYDLDTSFTGLRYVYGFINKCTCREALQQVAFDIGAIVTCARSNVVRIVPMELARDITTPDHTIDISQKGLGQPVSLLPLVTGVEITSHLYLTGETDDYESLLKGNFDAGDYRIFFGLDIPVYDSFIVTGATNTSTGDWRGTYIDINVAIPGTVEIVGAKYRDAQQIHSIYNTSLPAATQPNIVRIQDATLVTSFVQAGFVHGNEVVQRVYDYYQQRYLQKAKFYGLQVAPGDSVLIASQSAWVAGIIERMDTDLTGGFVSKVEIVGVVVYETEESMNNLLTNGSFSFAQRQAPGTLTTLTQDKCSADRWRISRENADLQYQRNDAHAESGLTSRHYGSFKKITNTGKLMVYQILEGINTAPLKGKTVIFQARMKASAAKTIKMAVLELQNAGTMDSIPATFVSAWGANTVNPTLGANLAIITGAQSKSVTTAWQNFSVSVTVPTNSKNIIVALWSDSQFAANDILHVAEAGLYISNTVQIWKPRPYVEELSLCQRHYWKTFGIDTAPAQNVGLNTGEHSYTAVLAGAVAQRGPRLYFPAIMFATPTITTYNPAATNAQVRDGTATVDCSATATANASPNGFNISATGNASTAVGNGLRVHITAESEL